MAEVGVRFPVGPQMFIHLPRLITRWSVAHRNALVLISSVSITRYATTAVWGILPAVIAFSYGEWVAGIFFGVFNLFQAFVGDPLAGSFADRWGSKPVVLVGHALVAASGIFWFAFPLTNIPALLFFGILFFLSFSCRDESAAYLLRTGGKEEGGLIFGVAENIYAMANFLASLSLPFLVLAGHESIAAAVMIATSLCGAVMLARIPNDRGRRSQKRWTEALNFIGAIRDGLRFVKSNHLYPLLALGSAAFEGLFYGVLWFAIPLEIVGGGSFSIVEGLELGIYEIVTVFFAGYAGYLADRYHWRAVHLLGWVLAAVGAIGLLWSPGVWPLVIAGALIGIGNNFFAFAASHALEAHDIDHRRDGAFVGLSNMVSDLGYAVGPLVAGILYSTAGFGGSIAFAVAVTILIGSFMTVLARRLPD